MPNELLEPLTSTYEPDQIETELSAEASESEPRKTRTVKRCRFAIFVKQKDGDGFVEVEKGDYEDTAQTRTHLRKVGEQYAGLEYKIVQVKAEGTIRVSEVTEVKL